MKLIDREAVVAEIGKRIKAIPIGETDKCLKAVYGNEAFVLNDLLSFIDSMQEECNITGIKSKEATGKLKECIDNTTEESLAKARKQLQEEPKACMYSKDSYTDEDRKVLCDGCEEECRFNKKEDSASEELEKVVEEIVDPTVLNAYGVKEIANRLRRTMMDSVSEIDFEAEVKKLWMEINTGHSYSIVDSYNIFYGLCMDIVDWQKEQQNIIEPTGEGQVKESLISEHEDKTCKENGNSLTQEPVSEDLEEAVNAYIGYAPEVDESPSTYGKRQAFKAGANWQKEQMIAKAVKVKISNAGIVSLSVNCDLKVGDKVLIIKEN